MHPVVSILIQSNTTDLPTYLLAIGSLVLLLLTFALFALSLIARYRHRIYEENLESRKDALYPHIMDYLEGSMEREKFEYKLSGKRIDFIAFEEIIYELLTNIKGDDAEKLQKLLQLEAVYQYHVELLYSYLLFNRINAYNYFNYINLDDKLVAKKITEDLYQDRQLLAFSAASALMASTHVSIRAQALEAIVRRPRISNMAILEMLYKFHNEDASDMDCEADYLKKIINNKEYPSKNIAIIIQGVSEIGYHQLPSMLNEKFYSSDKWWQQPQLLAALIEALGNFYLEDASTGIRSYIYHTSRQVRRACVDALARLSTPENTKALFNMLYDPDFDIKFRAVKSLLEAGEEGEAWLNHAKKLEETNPALSLYVEPIIHRIEAHHGVHAG